MIRESRVHTTEILAFVRRHPRCTESHIAVRLGYTREGALVRLKKLEARGKVQSEVVYGLTTRTEWRVA